MDLKFSLSKEYKNSYGSTYYINSNEPLEYGDLDVRYGIQSWEGRTFSISVFNKLKKFNKLQKQIEKLTSNLDVKEVKPLVKSGQNDEYVSLRLRPKQESLNCKIMLNGKVLKDINTTNLSDFDTKGVATISFSPSVFINTSGIMYISLKPNVISISVLDEDSE